MTGTSAIFSSPNFPNAYPHNLDCQYRVQVPAGKTIELYILHLELEHSHDNLVIYDGHSSTSTQIATLTGTTGSGRKFVTTGNELFVTFRSDGSVTRKGFQAVYTISSSQSKESKEFLSIFEIKLYNTSYYLLKLLIAVSLVYHTAGTIPWGAKEHISSLVIA